MRRKGKPDADDPRGDVPRPQCRAKTGLVRELTEGTVRALGVPASAVEVQLFEIQRDAWAVGGVLYSDKDSAPPPTP